MERCVYTDVGLGSQRGLTQYRETLMQPAVWHPVLCLPLLCRLVGQFVFLLGTVGGE